jgi:DNA-cytosine methyltransferase
MIKEYNVLSLFGGMETGRQALENNNINIGKYYSSEIKKPAIKFSSFHFPEIIHLGDINNWKNWNIDWKNIDLILSGSPCQDLSAAGKRAGINGKKSSLFWVFIEILNHIKTLNPNVLFFQENVGSAPKLDIGIMSRAMGVYPILLNSKLVTGQNRNRYYWCDFKTKPDGLFGDLFVDIPPPKDRKISFASILENGFTLDEKAKSLLQSEAKTFGYKNMNKFKALILRRLKKNKQNPNLVYSFTDREKCNAILESEGGAIYKDKDKFLKRYYKHATHALIFYIENDVIDIRNLTKIELCRLQGFPDDYCDILTRNQTASLLGDGWTLPMIEYLFSFLPFEKY